MSEKPIFNVAQLLKEPVGATRNGEIDAQLKDLVSESELKQVGAADDLPEISLAGPVRLMHTVNGVLVQGDLEAEVVLQCARCLEPVTISLEVPVEETFEPTLDIATGQMVKPEEEDKALWINEHHILDMSEVLRQDVLLEMPVHVLCRPDCRGLCSTCGQNLNEGTCDCEAEPDPRWAQLTELLREKENHNPEKE
jgi:uncharacterized protein